MCSYKKFLTVFIFIGTPLAIFQLSGLREHFNLAFLQQIITENLKNKLAIRLLAKLDARPIASIVLLRVLFQTFPALNYALAMSGVKFRNYLIGTLLGLPLPIIFYCWIFDYLAKALKIV
jgi:uncharacterized membrane protein YdjX (TVP38/TMEM64 family)